MGIALFERTRSNGSEMSEIDEIEDFDYEEMSDYEHREDSESEEEQFKGEFDIAVADYLKYPFIKKYNFKKEKLLCHEPLLSLNTFDSSEYKYRLKSPNTTVALLESIDYIDKQWEAENYKRKYLGPLYAIDDSHLFLIRKYNNVQINNSNHNCRHYTEYDLDILDFNRHRYAREEKKSNN